MRDSLARHGLLMVLAGVGVGGLNYLFQVLMAIMLSPTDYGSLFSLMALFTVFAVGSKALFLSVSRFASAAASEGALGEVVYLWGLVVRRTSIVLFLLLLGVGAISSYLASFLKIDDPWLIIALGFAFSAAAILSINEGLLQGLERFAGLSGSNILAPFSKLLLGVAFIIVGMDVLGGLLAMTIGCVVAISFGIWALRDLLGIPRTKVSLQGFLAFSRLAFVTGLLWVILISMDIILVKHYLDGSEAGDYSAVAVLGRIALYMPAGISVVMFPKIVAKYHGGQQFLDVLFKATGITLVFGIGVLVMYSVVPSLFIDVILRGKYNIAVLTIIEYTIAMSLFALMSTLMQFFLAVKETRVVLPIGLAVGVELAWILLSHESADQIVRVVLGTSIIGTIGMALLLSLFVRRTRIS